MLQNVWAYCSIPLVVGLWAVVGCGGGGNPRSSELIPVSGLVNYNGQPVAGASVTFHPAGAVGIPGSVSKPAARAKTDAQGRFRLWTFELNDGAVPGEHEVTINKVEIVPPDVDADDPAYDSSIPEPPPRYLVPEKYGNQRTSGLTATVNPEGENEFVFDLQG